MAGLTFVLVVVFGLPLLWQATKLLWPLRLDSSGTHFTGRLFRRYSVDVFTGYASAIETGVGEALNTGGVSGTGYTTGSGVTSVSVRDTRRTFVMHHTSFFLEDHASPARHVDAINVAPAIASGHLVSAAWLVRGGKVGNAFLVYDHDTGMVYIEKTKRGQRNAKRGLVRMVMPFPEWFQALIFITIVGIPVMIVIGLGVQWKVSRFGKRGAVSLEALMQSRAQELRDAAARSSVAAPSPSTGSLDVAAQIKELAALHGSGSLTSDEFAAAKAKLLEPS